MSIYPPEKVWWKPIDKEEKIWFFLALFWMLFTFFFMPVWHVIGKQNPSSESYKITKEEFKTRADDFIQKFQVGEENGVPIVHPPPGSDIYLIAKAWSWAPILELDKGETYRLHLSSLDFQHGFSIFPLNINYMVIPGQDYVITVTPTTTGDFTIICNEYCGAGHHFMAGKLIVK